MTDRTELILTTLEAFEELQDVTKLDHVRSLHIGARLYNTVPHTWLFEWISKLEELRTIRLADDWIADDQMGGIASEFALAFPMIDFGWANDGLAGGKHGQ